MSNIVATYSPKLKQWRENVLKDFANMGYKRAQEITNIVFDVQVDPYECEEIDTTNKTYTCVCFDYRFPYEVRIINMSPFRFVSESLKSVYYHWTSDEINFTVANFYSPSPDSANTIHVMMFKENQNV